MRLRIPPGPLHDPGTGAQSFYLFGIRDDEGRLLNGTDTYRLRVPADTPVRDFWSVIVYSMKTKGFVEKVDRVGLASRDKKTMGVNDDGSVDLYFAPTPPKGLEGNWVPTGGEDFFLIFRLYGPEAPVLQKTWVLGDVERIR